jgi:hypothetical protein
MNISVVARQEARVGGITAYNNADVIECYSNASITARSTNSTSFTYIGGLIGYNDSLGSVKYAYVKGSVNAQSTATNVFAGGVIGFSKNAQMQFAYSAIMQIVVQTDTSGTIAKLGGTLCGYVDTKTSSGYKNYYAFTEAFGREGDESLFSSEKVDVSAYNALASLVQTINFNIGQPIFMFNGQDIVLVWENA